MRIGFSGRLLDEPQVRAGFIGCGSHSFRNIYPTFQHAPVDLVATCDLDGERAAAFAGHFGADASYTDFREMLEKESLDAVFIVTSYDPSGRPLYPDLAVAAMDAGCHVFIEKPPAASCAGIERMQAAAQRNGKNVLVGLKKMFFPANEKAKELAYEPEFGKLSLATLQYPQHIPTVEQFAAYAEAGGGALPDEARPVISFLDHLCHPASLMVELLGMPDTLSYERSSAGSGVATFTFASGIVASLALTGGASLGGGMERTTLVSDRGRHIVVDNNIRLSYHQTPPDLGYGTSPSFYQGGPGDASTVWEPEFSLGQLYNKGLFLLGYYGEVNEFARSILEERPPRKGTLEQAWQVTRIFEAFAHGPGRRITLLPL